MTHSASHLPVASGRPRSQNTRTQARLVGHQHANGGRQRFCHGEPLALPAADAARERVPDLQQAGRRCHALALAGYPQGCRPRPRARQHTSASPAKHPPTCVSAHSSRPSVRSSTSTYSCWLEESAASAAMAAAMAGSGRMPSSFSLASSAASSSAHEGKGAWRRALRIGRRGGITGRGLRARAQERTCEAATLRARRKLQRLPHRELSKVRVDIGHVRCCALRNKADRLVQQALPIVRQLSGSDLQVLQESRWCWACSGATSWVDRSMALRMQASAP